MTCGMDFAPVPFTKVAGKTVSNLTPARKRDDKGNVFILFGSELPQDSAFLSNVLMIPTSPEAAWYAVLQIFIPDPHLLLNDDAKRYDPPPIVEIASKEEWECGERS
ncbi:hypothetical protein M427DRAFT_155392 [Gonapodya prolifera JEL478]|uniref:Uncharacterized protein n=1 Tax=Gonapodya prolifera (strain JEL478) TaxID=1344416 RepID=A0A139AF73_GONPJ|nr:hypothetical protein M427DRAFT_155392 [Gonapodya prolifera JEL478]|eukprot:KXS15472.1 hypothetical protein M427DRAFT_155392 [Gonapodya prolifera JEL478]